MSSRPRLVMNALTRGMPKSVGMDAPLVSTCLPLLSSHVYGKAARRETSLSNFLGSGRFHIFGAGGG
jgi:hypothetical protein